ncbi:hypothetical protein Tco_1204300 [Tanacetum coccineum]
MSSASSAVTYTSVYTDSEPGRAFWGADDEEISEGGIPRVIVYGYDGLPIQPVAPPSPDYIPGPEDPQTPPVPQDEDEREPMFVQAHDPDYVPEPVYPEYIPLEDEHVFPAEEQPLPPVDSPTAESPGYITESDPEEDPEEYEDDETEDGPVDYPMDGGDDGDDDDGDSSGDDADDEDEDDEEEEDFGRLCWERLARCTAPSAHSSPPPALVDAVTTTLPSPPLPPLLPSLYIPPHVDHRDINPESEQLPRKRSCLFVLGSRYEVRESSTARPTEGRGVDYGFVSTLDAEERHEGLESSSETKQIVEEEAYFPEGLAHAIGLSQAAHYELQTHREQIEKMESVFNTSGCAIENQVKFATCTLLGAALTWWNGQIRTLGPDAYSMTWEVLKKKMTDKYCPQGEIKKLEIEL